MRLLGEVIPSPFLSKPLTTTASSCQGKSETLELAEDAISCRKYKEEAQDIFKAACGVLFPGRCG
jgi:hypothetical protein